jgi:hypothetical protein
MRLCSSDGHSIELRIVGYEFSNLANTQFHGDLLGDANWLCIEGSVNHPRGAWTFRVPCLSNELVELADWLEAVARNDSHVEDYCTFMEPDLNFCVHHSDVSTSLRVYLECAARPTWADVHVYGEDDLWVEFPISEIPLSEAARSLRQQQALYPQRAIPRRIGRTQLAMYVANDGKRDLYERRGQTSPDMVGVTWGRIADLAQRIYIVESGRGSRHFRETLEADLLASTEDDQARQMLRDWVKGRLQSE